MRIIVISLFLAGVIVVSVIGFSPRKIYPRRNLLLRENDNDTDVGEPLLLSPFIKSGQIEMGRKLANVSGLKGSDIESYSGYFTVNNKLNSNMFFWFFPAAYNPETAPVMIWLQGGPGGSSLFGLFVENGPFSVDKDNNLKMRNTAWTLTHSVIYIENPVGTGFSFTDSDDGYAKNEDDVARDLYSLLTQFFTMFPEYRERDFYITGESYAGKYIPAISYKIHMENQNSPPVFINLKGMAIGDGFSDPVNMLNYGDYLFNVGLLDETDLAHFHKEEQKVRDAINKKDWKNAQKIMDELMDGDIYGTPYFTNVTGFTFYFNFLMSEAPADHSYYSNYVQGPDVRRSLHVRNISYDEDSKVEDFLKEDMYQSVAPWISALLDAPEGYRILFYSGQLDIIVANINTEEMLRKLKWGGSKEYLASEKKKWRVRKEIGGYVRTARNLTYLLVRNAGHILPYDQPKFSYDMINRFTAGKPFA